MSSIRSNDGIGGLSIDDRGLPSIGSTTEAKGGASFADTLKGAIGEVDKLQTEADVQSTKVANGEGNLHETALALEKADVAMRLATKVRNKMVDTYQDIMRMSV